VSYLYQPSLSADKATNDFVRIWIDQIARVTAPERREWWLERVNTTLNPFARERGDRWKVHIDETPIDFWTIQGMKPPDPIQRLKSTGSKRTARWYLPKCEPNPQQADRGDGYQDG
jgi:hypothetical protein